MPSSPPANRPAASSGTFQNVKAAVGTNGPQLERSGGFDSSPAQITPASAVLKILIAIASPPEPPRAAHLPSSFADEKCKRAALVESAPAVRRSRCPRL